MPLSDEQWTGLARGLRRTAARFAPAWSNGNAHDPGVAVLQLLAYALDELAQRDERLSGAARELARDVARRAGALVDDGGAACGNPPSGGLVRPRYFAGQLLTAADFRLEQEYVIDHLRRRNRALHGAGIVEGLAVSLDGSSARHVVISPGLAFDSGGREICVACAHRLALPAAGASLLVEISYRESETANVATNVPTADAGATATQATRVVETFAASLAEAANDGSLQIARLRRVRGCWRVDPAFRAAHVRR